MLWLALSRYSPKQHLTLHQITEFEALFIAFAQNGTATFGISSTMTWSLCSLPMRPQQPRLAVGCYRLAALFLVLFGSWARRAQDIGYLALCSGSENPPQAFTIVCWLQLFLGQ
jgi:hypothetical protein